MHHKRDWSKYNRALVNRGNINLWVSAQALESWIAKKEKKNGHPFVYGDELIKAMCFVRFKFHLSLRETEGFFHCLTKYIGISFKTPSYTQLCRRMKLLSLSKHFLKRRQVTDIIIDTTGLKVYGAGEWRGHRYGSQRRWKKLHLALEPKSGKLVFAKMTNEHVHDTQYIDEILEHMNRRPGRVLFDSIADSRRCYGAAQKYNKRLLTPPKQGAVLRSETEFESRNDAIKIIHGLGGKKRAKSLWGKLVGYSRRAVIESMIARWKQLFGGRLRSHCNERRKVEVHLKSMMINHMISQEET